MGTFTVDSREQKLANQIARLKPYKSSKAIFDQTGTGAPTLNTIIYNDLDIDFSDSNWIYDTAGIYVFNLTNLGDLLTQPKITTNAGISTTSNPSNILHSTKFSAGELYIMVIDPLIIGTIDLEGQFWIEIIKYN